MSCSKVGGEHHHRRKAYTVYTLERGVGKMVFPVAGIEVSVWVPLVAGLGGIYGERDLIGRQVVVMANLEPVTLMGVESRGMILAAEDESGVHVLMPDARSAPGSKVR